MTSSTCNDRVALRKKFLNYLLPSVTAMWVFSFYTMVDGIFVGRGVGPTALAAVNISMPFINTIFACSILFSIGDSTVISMYLGQKKIKEGKEVLSLVTAFIILFSILVFMLTIANLENLAIFLGATELTLPFVKDYLSIIVFFNGFFMVSYCLELMCKTDGFPCLAIIGVVSAALCNIVLDYIFVIKLGFGVKGAAFATGISQGISCLFFLYHFLGSKSNLGFVKFKVDFNTLKRIITIGIPDALTEVASGVVILLFNHFILKYIGESGIVAYSVICYVNTFIMMTMIGITQGMQPLSSFHYGAEELENVKTLFKMSCKTLIFSSIFLFLISFTFNETMVSIFIDPNETDLFAYACEAFKIYSFSFLLLGFNILVSGFSASLEKPFFATVISISRGFIVVTISLIVMTNLFGATGIWMSTIVSEAVVLILSLIIIRKLFKETLNSEYSLEENLLAKNNYK